MKWGAQWGIVNTPFSTDTDVKAAYERGQGTVLLFTLTGLTPWLTALRSGSFRKPLNYATILSHIALFSHWFLSFLWIFGGARKRLLGIWGMRVTGVTVSRQLWSTIYQVGFTIERWETNLTSKNSVKPHELFVQVGYVSWSMHSVFILYNRIQFF